MGKRIALPCAPQPKQWKHRLLGLTETEGERALGERQQAVHSRPAFFSGTRRSITSTMSTRESSSSMKVSGIRPRISSLVYGGGQGPAYAGGPSSGEAGMAASAQV